MALQAGKSLGPYEVLAPLGAGGMGEVYRARDTRLGRQVALKTLPAGLAADAERLARFDREARALAALNHPSIGALYGLEEADGVRVLVLELVEGETLAERIARGALPLADALRIAVPIAAALEAAHEQGIVHRDLKPANVKLREDGAVKVLDFGLAKLSGGAASSPALSSSPTQTSTGTREGVILGTAPYMSPEQARGKAVDGRSDVWSFGCLLYEMLTGRPAFGGETVADVITAVLGREPEWGALPPETPVAVRRLLRRCLEKDPKQRLHHFADVRLEVEDATGATTVGPPPSAPVAHAARRWRALALGALAGLLAVAALALWRRGGAGALSPFPTGQAIASRLTRLGGTERAGALSPDGRSFVFVSSHAGAPDIWLRQVAGGEPVRLTNDDAAEADLAYAPDGETIYFTRTEAGSPSVWRIGALGGQPRRVALEAFVPAPSPDGRRLAYYARDRDGGALFVSAADGSGARVLTRDTASQVPALAWSPDSRWLSLTRGGLFTSSNLVAIEVDSGRTRALTRFEGAEAGIGAHQWLPDGKRIVVVYASDWTVFHNDIGILDVASGGITRLTMNVAQSHHQLSLSADGSRLLATTVEVRLEIWKVPLGPDPDANGSAAVRLLDASHDPMWISVSRDGQTLLYNGSLTGSRNLWMRPLDDSAPARQITAFPGNAVMHSSLSPDGRRVAYVSMAGGRSDLWTQSTDGSDLRRLTNDEAADAWPVWSPDGRFIVYNSLRAGRRETWRIGSDGASAEKLVDGFFRGDWIQRPGGDGTLIVTATGGPSPRSGARLVDVERRTVIWERELSGANVAMPLFSPDGRSISIAGQEGGRDVVLALDTATGTPRVLVRFPDPFRALFRAGWAEGGRALVVNRYFDSSRIDLIDRLSATGSAGGR